MIGNKFISRFLFLVTISTVSMLLIIPSPRLIRILFAWDLLESMSYRLVIYYQLYAYARRLTCAGCFVLHNGDLDYFIARSIARRAIIMRLRCDFLKGNKT